MENKDFQEERDYLARVENYIDKRTAQLLEKKEDLKQDIGAGRRSMWEEGRHGVCDFDDVVDLYLHSESIVADEKQYVENLKELQRLEQMKENPYFARIDAEEKGYPEEAVYIGAVGLRDDKTYDMYVCDWRAPISSLFYGFDVGEAWYDVDGRRVEVQLKRKRQIQIAGGELQSIYDTDSSMHDAILGDILSANTGNKLKVIISSIQKEQNTAIRKIDKPAVLIYGPAGSGKTSVGLHRLAYILYHQRERLSAENIVILSNNNIYHSYVSGILPALCEDEVSHTIFHELLRRFLPRGIRVESYYAQYSAMQESGAEATVVEKPTEATVAPASREITETTAASAPERTTEATVAPTLEERKAWLALKYSPEMVEHIKRYFEEYEFEMVPLRYRGRVIVSAEELRGKFQRNRYGSFRGRFEGLLETVRKLYDDYLEEHKEEICEEIEARVDEYVSAQELEILFLKARKRAVQEAVEELRAKNMPDAGKLLPHILETFTQTSAPYDMKECQESQTSAPYDLGECQKHRTSASHRQVCHAMARALRRDLEQGTLWYEDALLYLLVRIYLGEVPAFENVLHVLVDEAQDYHILQLTILRLLYPRSAFTLLADVCQAISPMTTIQSYEAFYRVFGDSMESLPLLKSYRSSGPINTLAFHLMSKFQPEYAEKYSYFQREGRLPEYIVSGDICATILGRLKKLQQYNTVGIVTADERSAYKLHQKLRAAGAQTQLITKPYDEMKERIIVMPLILTKGLEFDAVLVCGCVRGGCPQRELAARMYLACTRALHELIFVEEEELPQELEDCNKFIEKRYK